MVKEQEEQKIEHQHDHLLSEGGGNTEISVSDDSDDDTGSKDDFGFSKITDHQSTNRSVFGKH
jgi:hypothetical protein